jgi:hypothetical protein
MKKILAVLMAIATLALGACATGNADLKSPCAGTFGSPCNGTIKYPNQRV